MATTRRLKEMSWTTFVEHKKHTDLVIIPTGAIEVYGPHLPLGSDTLLAEKLAELVAERVGGIVGPTLEAGDSTVLSEFPGTITIRPESFKAYLGDVLDSLVKWGFTQVLFINGHAGNVPLINQVVNPYRNVSDLRFAQIDGWRLVKSQEDQILEPGPWTHGHAGEAGTSVLLHLYPHLVDESQVKDEVPDHADLFPEIIKYDRLSSKTQSGVIGYPSRATRDKGEALVQKSVDKIVSFLHETWEIAPLQLKKEGSNA
ncbi:creatininase family protein [Paenibacillus filicis]|uniref:Creatininase family protein n=1 Tax=Paenibacillus filicis TaxID=669464 RepID=A0ABU9DG25_9BACL